jgi:hypothetical protein
MRPRVVATLLVLSIGIAAVFAATASGRSQAPGDGCLVVQNGYGKVTISLTRGVILGRFQSGALSFTDTDVTDTTLNLPTVPGVSPTTKFGTHTWVYSGTDVRFWTKGPTKLTINAQYMNLSAAGKGWTRLWVGGGPSAFSQDIAGKFSVDDASFCGDNFQKMPLSPTRFQISSPVAG